MAQVVFWSLVFADDGHVARELCDPPPVGDQGAVTWLGVKVESIPVVRLETRWHVHLTIMQVKIS